MRARMFLAVALAVAAVACKGGTGPKGAAGDKGDTGDPGTTGKAGSNGTNGTNGTMGAMGAKGADGATGRRARRARTVRMVRTVRTGTERSDGTNGTNGTNGNDIILSENARVGLKLSEVPVDPTGLNGDDIESVGRGAYLVNAVADCNGCHNGAGRGQPLFLAGNDDFPIGAFDTANTTADPFSPCTGGSPPSACVDGHVFTRNLTPDATTGLKLSEDQFIRRCAPARTSRTPTGGAALIVMPWPQLRWLTRLRTCATSTTTSSNPGGRQPVQTDVKPMFPPPPLPSYAATGDPVAVPVFADSDFGDGFQGAPVACDVRPGRRASPRLPPASFRSGQRVARPRDLAAQRRRRSSPTFGDDQALYGRGSYIVNGPGLCNECHTAGGRNQMANRPNREVPRGRPGVRGPPPLQTMLGQVRTMSAQPHGRRSGFTLRVLDVRPDTWLSGMSFTRARRTCSASRCRSTCSAT